MGKRDTGKRDDPTEFAEVGRRCSSIHLRPISRFRQPVMRNRNVVSEFPDYYYMTDATNNHAVEIIKQFGQDENPFFVYVSLLLLIVQHRPGIKTLNGTEENSWRVGICCAKNGINNTSTWD